MDDSPSAGVAEFQVIHGSIDTVTAEGVVEGWAWNGAAPSERVEITAYVDGVVAGGGTADLFRPDLLAANIGDGGHAFRFVLDTLDPNKRSQAVTIRRTRGGVPIKCNPFVIHNPNAVSMDDRLYELEARNRLLESRIKAMAEARRGESSPRELFSVVGAFFMQLARDAEAGMSPSAEPRLKSIIEANAAAHPPISLPTVRQPKATICIEASAPLAALHDGMEAMLRSGVANRASIIVIDSGAFDEVALAPSLIRGLIYHPLFGSPIGEMNQIVRTCGTDLVVFLNGALAIPGDWLSDIEATFERGEAVAAVGGALVDQDGTVLNAGLTLDKDGRLTDTATQTAMSPAGMAAHPVQVLSRHIVAFRRQAFIDGGGLDEAFDDVEAAFTDLAFRLGRSGWSLWSQPAVGAQWRPSLGGDGWWTGSWLARPSRSGDLLRSRWLFPPATDGEARS